MAIPAYGSLVPLIGRINTSVLAIGQVRWFTWSAYFQQLVEHGYADIYDPMEPGVVVALKVDGTAATYASLPTTGLTPGMVYVVQENGRAYVWNGTAWPAQASGISITGPTGPGGVGIANITISGTNLVFDMTDGPDITRAVPALEDAQAWRDQVEQFVQLLQTTVAPEVEAERAAAEGAAAAAATAQGVSEDARDAALGAQGTATTEANRARDEADDAAESATLAGGHADAAGQSAGAAATAKGQVDATKGQIDTIKGEIDTARDDAIAARGAAVAAAGEAHGFRDDAEQIVADAAAGVVPDNGVSTVKVQNGAVTLAKLSPELQTTADKADTAVQPAALTTKADLVGGVIPSSQIPAVGLVKPSRVANRTEMLALTAQEGDVAVVTGTADKGSYMLGAGPSTSFASWVLLNAPDDLVSSVNGMTGVVVLGKGNVGLGNVDNTSDATKFTNPDVIGKLTTPQLKVSGGSPGAGKVLTSDADGNATWQRQASAYSEAYVTGSTTVTASNGAAVQNSLNAVVTDPAHTFATDGITVPTGSYLVTVEARWATAESAKRSPGVYDGTRHRVLGTYADTASTLFQSLVFMIDVIGATAKLGFSFFVDTSSGGTRLLASGTDTRIKIRRIG